MHHRRPLVTAPCCFRGSPAALVGFVFLGWMGPGCQGRKGDTGEPPPVESAADEDGDGFTTDEDCDDTDAAVNPAQDESCNGVDDDCDGIVDEDDAVDASIWYLDADGDGFGDAESSATACEAPSDYVSDDTDCDDADATVNPDADEVCGDGVDNDCEGTVDGDDAVDVKTWFEDADGDGYGDPESQHLSCEQESGYVANSEDCDDSSAEAWPGHEEICGDGIDNNCDGFDEACGMYGEVVLGDATPWLEGVESSGAAGRSVALVEDLDGDGFDDMLVGAYRVDSGAEDAGAAYLVSGPVTDTVSLSDATAELQGGEASEYAGVAVDGAGDVDGDGWDDVLVGAHYADAGAEDGGAAYLVAGPLSGSLALSSAHAVLTGPESEAHAGISLAGGGNVNGDGYADFVVGSGGLDTGGSNAGAAWVLYGPVSGEMGLDGADAVRYGEAAGDNAGRAVAAAGDVDGDGRNDFLVGARQSDRTDTDAGAAYVLFGPVSGSTDLGDAGLILAGESGGDLAGSAVAGAGDIDGDGLDDLLVGAPGESTGGVDAGAAYLVSGGQSGSISLGEARAVFHGATKGDEAGGALTGAGDVDADGNADFAVAADEESSMGNGAGAVYLFLGPVSGGLSVDEAQAVYLGPDEAATAGRSVAGGGDVTRSGYGDLLIGAPGATGSVDTSGAAMIVLGGPSPEE